MKQHDRRGAAQKSGKVQFKMQDSEELQLKMQALRESIRRTEYALKGTGKALEKRIMRQDQKRLSVLLQEERQELQSLSMQRARQLSPEAASPQDAWGRRLVFAAGFISVLLLALSLVFYLSPMTASLLSSATSAGVPESISEEALAQPEPSAGTSPTGAAVQVSPPEAEGFSVRPLTPPRRSPSPPVDKDSLNTLPVFAAGENPTMQVKLPATGAGGITGAFVSASTLKELVVKLKDPAGNETLIRDALSLTGEGYEISIPSTRYFRPGKYTLSVADENNLVLTQQDFTWGVLAINTHKSIYLPGEEAFIGMAVLDDLGLMLCDAEVVLEIISPDKQKTTLRTADGTIRVSEECEVFGVTALPDYYASYATGGVGTYLMNLTAFTYNGVRSMMDEFMVAEEVEFDVSREGPTRIYPAVPYTMKFTITAHEDFTGVIQEYVPASFEIRNIQLYEIDEKEEKDAQKSTISGTAPNGNRKSPNQAETVQPDRCSGTGNYINLSPSGKEECKATVAQSGRAPALGAGVQPDIRVQIQNLDESPGGGAQPSDTKTVVIDADLQQGSTYLVTYEFDAPDDSPAFYLLGPLEIGRWKETRQWQMAADAPSELTDVFFAFAASSITLPSGSTTTGGIYSVSGNTWTGVFSLERRSDNTLITDSCVAGVGIRLIGCSENTTGCSCTATHTISCSAEPISNGNKGVNWTVESCEATGSIAYGAERVSGNQATLDNGGSLTVNAAPTVPPNDLLSIDVINRSVGSSTQGGGFVVYSTNGKVTNGTSLTYNSFSPTGLSSLNLSGIININISLLANGTHNDFVNVTFGWLLAKTNGSTMLNTTTYNATANQTRWNYSFNTNLLPDGIYNISVYVQNVSIDSVTGQSIVANYSRGWDIGIDRTPPNVTFFTLNISNGASVEQGTIIQFNASLNDSTLTVETVRFGFRSDANNTEFNVTALKVDYVWNVTLETSTMGAATYTVALYGNDTLGNLNNSVANLSFTVTVPLPTTLLSVDVINRSVGSSTQGGGFVVSSTDGKLTNGTSLTLNSFSPSGPPLLNLSGIVNINISLIGNRTHGNYVNVTFGWLLAKTNGSTMLNTTTYNATRNQTRWNYSFNTNLLPDGIYNISVYVQNITANGVVGQSIVVNYSRGYDIGIDRTPPNVTQLLLNTTNPEAMNASNFTNGGVLAFNITANDSTLTVHTVKVGLFNDLRNGTEFNVTAPRNNSGYHVAVPFNTLTDGFYTLKVYANDTLGNLNNSVANLSFRIDTTPPNVTWLVINTTSLNASNYTRGGVIDINVSTNDTTTSVQTVVVGIFSYRNSTEFNVTLRRNTSVWHERVGLSTLQDSQYLLRIYADDIMPFRNSSVQNTTIRVDGTAPNITYFYMNITNGSRVNATSRIEFNASVNDSTLTTETVLFGFRSDTNNTEFNVSASRRNGEFSIQLDTTPMIAAVYTVFVYGNDTLGNTNNSVGNLTFTLGVPCGNLTASSTLDMDASSEGTCYQIRAPNLVLDCAGRTVTYGTAGRGIGVNNSGNSTDGFGFGYDNVTIKNCNIVKGSTLGGDNIGIALVNALNNTIENNTIVTNGNSDSNWGILLQGADTTLTTLRNTTIFTNGTTDNYGINLEQAPFNVIENNSIYTNGTYDLSPTGNYGMRLSPGSNSNRVSYNTIYTNGSNNDNYGILLAGSNNTLQGNRIFTRGLGSSNEGIRLNSLPTDIGAVNNTLRDNIIFTSGATGVNYPLSFTNGANYTLAENNNLSCGGSTTNCNVILISGPSAFNILLNNNLTTLDDEEIRDDSPDDLVNYLIYNNSLGEIEWLDNGTGSFLRNLTLDTTLNNFRLGYEVFIGNNTFVLNMTGIILSQASGFTSRINSSANITFRGTNFSNITNIMRLHNYTSNRDLIIKDGVNCTSPNCFIWRNDSKTNSVYFNVSNAGGSYTANGTRAGLGEVNARPTAPVPVYLPENGSSITNRTPLFKWANATDADNDVISYHLQVDDSRTFLNPEINVSAILSDSYAERDNTTWYSTVTLNVDTQYFWRVRANDSGGFGGWSDSATTPDYTNGDNHANFTIDSLLQISFTNNQVQFGPMAPDEINGTNDGFPPPMRAENTGNIYFNISINGSAYFETVALNTSYYQYQIRENESGSFDTSLSSTTWKNMSKYTNISKDISRIDVVELNWRGVSNDFLMDINITIPNDEPSGLKSSNVTFTITGSNLG